MPRMVTFRLNRECRDVAVNPAKVLYVCHYETGASGVHFGRDCFVRVQGSLSEVVQRLEAAMNEPDVQAGPMSRDDQRVEIN